ncbi:MAG: 5-dehydro-4-deoxyglucarate dehydratase [Actinobacteria bacterium]|nr:5-dehydro-4-deoxyglucarate dehydratase [Actinomycetota bacterium]
MNLAPSGLLFFPITPFHDDSTIDLDGLERHLESGISHSPGGVFVACGAGEFHSLSEGEVQQIAQLTVGVIDGRAPIFLGSGGSIQTAKNISRFAKDVGISGLLVFPPYMVSPSQEGLRRYFYELAEASDLPLIAYNRPGSILNLDLVIDLLQIENLVGIKDGLGEMNFVADMMKTTRNWETQIKSSRAISFMNGTPTAEISALKFRDLGILTYSSAVLSFVPEISVAFYQSLLVNNDEMTTQLLKNFYEPLADLRDEVEGGAISIIKAGNRILGKDYGGVRAPLLDFNGDQMVRLNRIIKSGMELIDS